MNKILFKLIEGKGKFFFMRYPPELIFAVDDTSIKLYNDCISEALKNGEIVNPEVLPEVFIYVNAQGAETFFDMPEGMGFEPLEYPNKPVVRLLPEKPVQKEEQERDYARHKDYADSHYNKGFNEAIEEVYNLLKSKPQFKIEDYEFCTINIRSFFEEIEKLKR